MPFAAHVRTLGKVHVSPYRPLFTPSHPTDLLVILALVAIWLALGHSLRSRFAALPLSERYCAGLGFASLWLFGATATVFLIGLIFLGWLRIESGFWAIWQLFWILSVIVVFWVLPILVIFIALWGHIGRFAAGYKSRTLRICNVGLLGLVLNAGLYFALALSLMHE